MAPGDLVEENYAIAGAGAEKKAAGGAASQAVSAECLSIKLVR